MQRIDLIGAFRTASERGLPLEETKASLLSAGYNQQDVEDSAQAFLRGATKPTPPAKPLPTLPSLPSVPGKGPALPLQTKPLAALPPLTAAPLVKPAAQPVTIQEKRKIPTYLLIAIIATSIVVVAAVGFIVFSLISK